MCHPDFTALNAASIVAFIGDIFELRGADSYLGEAVTMSEHMLQGAQLAEEAGAGEHMVAAALLHDIGHYTNDFSDDALAQGIDNHHDEAGAAVIDPYFPSVVIDCVRDHVAAKRYLCATDPGYFNRLSEKPRLTRLACKAARWTRRKLRNTRALALRAELITNKSTNRCHGANRQMPGIGLAAIGSERA